MAVPKHKTSKARGRSRVANWKANVPTLVDCPQCHAKKPSHAVCPECGYYDGEKKVLVASDEKKSK